MSLDDRERWNQRYREAAIPSGPAVPAGLAPVVGLLPSQGVALDLACGTGAGAVWLARRGLDVVAVDASDVAIESAQRLAADAGVADRCQFRVHDLDVGLPPGEAVDLITCHLFSAPGLDEEIIGRLNSEGVLAITVLSEVDGEPGPYRARPGELLERFAALRVLAHREGEGTATLVGVATGPAPTTRLD